VSELRTEILVTNYARRKSSWSAFGHGFDTRHLHHKKPTIFKSWVFNFIDINSLKNSFLAKGISSDYIPFIDISIYILFKHK
jgi:hypothetical protein